MTIANAGLIHADISLNGGGAPRTVLNGYDLAGNAVDGPSRIEGDLYFNGSDDTVRVRNRGTILGDIYFGEGVNELYNSGTINGNISDVGGAANHIVLAGTLNGDGSLQGTTTLEVSGVLNGSIVLGGNDDTVIVNGPLTITGENSINVAGGAGDTVIYRGETGAVDAWRINAEKLIKDGGGTTILGSEGATYLGGITVANGTLMFGTDRADPQEK